MYATTCTYTIQSASLTEAIQRLQTQWISLISQVDDVFQCDAMRIGPNEVLTVSIFGTLVAAEQSILLTRTWVQEHLARLLQGASEPTMGWVFAGTSGRLPELATSEG